MKLIKQSYGNTLEDIEQNICTIIGEYFIDQDGLLIGAINGDTLLPFTNADMKGVRLETTLGADLGAPHKYKLLLMNYEETGMAHGDYLMALLEKYKATGSEQVKKQAHQAFLVIKQLADTIAETNPYGRGWWPKPYGGLKDLNEMFETSIDQVTKIVLALAKYDRELATVEERDWIRMQVRAIADWWIHHHYTTRYFGNVCWWDLHEAPHSAAALLYLVRQAMAWSKTSPKHLEQAWEHLMGHRKWLLLKKGGNNSHNLAIECVHRLEVLDPDHQKLWRRSRNILIEHSIAGTNLETGTNYVSGYGRYNTGLRMACSGAIVYDWTHKRKYADIVGRMLKIYNKNEKFYHHDQDYIFHKPNLVSCWNNAISGHQYAAWLLAYWRLRNSGYNELAVTNHLK